MPFRVLVLTPDIKLGEFVRQVLVDAQGCQVVLAHNNRQALRLARQVVFDLAILDENPSEDSLPELSRWLLEYQPHLSIAPLRQPAGSIVLNESARLPDEIAAVLRNLETVTQRQGATESEATGSVIAVQAQAGADSNWLLDPGRTEQRLKSIHLPNLIYAAVVVRRESLWAYRGSLPRAMAGALAHKLAQSWNREQDSPRGAGRAGGDLMRFISLDAKQEFLLYARGLRYGLVLGLAFPTTTPFKAARSHMEQVLREMVAIRTNGKERQADPAAGQPENSGLSQPLPALEPAGGSVEAGSVGEPALELALPEFSALLGEVPEPTPPSMRRYVPGAEHISWPWHVEAKDFPEEASAWLQSNNGQSSTISGEHTCAFVLTPRCKQHMLRDQIAVHVYQRLSEIAYQRSWRLQGVSVRPNYLLFTAVLPQSESSAQVLQAMRQELSSSLFATFPDLAESCQEDDFWAAEDLLSESGQPFLAQELRQYLQRVGRWLKVPVVDARSQDLDR